MSIVLVVVCVIALFIYFEVLLQASRFLHGARAVKAVDRYCDSVVARIFSLLRTYCAFEIVYEDRLGPDLPERFILVANHQSLLDIPLCMRMIAGRRLRFVAKKELGAGIPFVSSVLRTQGHALITRKGDTAQAMGAIRRFARRSRREGTCPVLFPEGTRSRDGKLGPFYTAGLRKVLEEGPLPLVVAAIDGGWRIAKLKDLYKSFRGIRYELRLAAVLPAPSGKKETLEALAAARDIISSELADMRAASA
ncbi:MAG TPA: lysophospholipid acyltransferase family protein [Spirochaetia bacterium]|nr:lysophospholipid acyltransferase family protein [Spirochaetia bacterium]